MMLTVKVAAHGGSDMRYAVLGLFVAAACLAFGCAGPSALGTPPVRLSYEDWAREMARIPEIVRAEQLCEAALVHHRNANIMTNRLDIYEEYTMATSLFAMSADQLYVAWELHPAYRKFILMELDKVYGYINECVSYRPHYFEPTDPLNIFGGAMTYEQRQRMQQYRKVLSKWQQAVGK